MTRNHNAMLEWDHVNERYMPGWYIGSENDDGEHIRNQSGWPYSIYRMGAQPGATDAVICHGIQALQDAEDLCVMLNKRAGVI